MHNLNTPRKDMFVNIVTVVWIVTNLVTFWLTADILDVMAVNLGFMLFLLITLKTPRIMKWLNKSE